jgi:hypothetical protein
MSRGISFVNNTRYFTEDIAHIVEALGGGVGGSRDRAWQVTVDYYSASKDSFDYYKSRHGVGLYVKLMRNGDESSWHKDLKLVKPTRFKGLSELEQLAALANNEAPNQVICQLMKRFRLMAQMDFAHKGPSWARALISPNELTQMNRFVKENQLKLRFHDRDPSPDIKDWRRKLGEAELNLSLLRRTQDKRAKNIVAAEKGSKHYAELLAHLTRDKDQGSAHITKAELAVEDLLLGSGGEMFR